MTDFDYSWTALLQPQRVARVFALEHLPPLEPAAAFCSDRAWWMAALCQAAYLWNHEQDSTPPEAGFRRRALENAGFAERGFIDQGPIQGVLAERGDLCVLAYRGTDELDDWRTNVRIEPAPWPGGGRVHSGFLEAFDAVVPMLMELRQRYSRHHWLLTGHSQGAAMAVLSAAMTRPLAVYGFGCPRMADRRFCAGIDEVPIYQVVNDRDIVPRLPPEIGDFAAQLPGRTLRLSGGELRVAHVDATPESAIDVRALFARLASPGEWNLPIRELSDHAIVNYVAALERLRSAAHGIEELPA